MPDEITMSLDEWARRSVEALKEAIRPPVKHVSQMTEAERAETWKGLQRAEQEARSASRMPVELVEMRVEDMTPAQRQRAARALGISNSY